MSSSPTATNFTDELRREGALTLRLAIPLIIGQVSQLLMGVVDTLMIGRVGVTELAASAFANTLVNLPMMFGIGLTTAISVRVSQARGANNPPAARAALRHGLQIAFLMGALSFFAFWILLPFLGIFRQSPEVRDAAPGYLMWVAASLIPTLTTLASKNHADAMNRPWPAFWIIFASVFANALLNWIFIFGHLGIPALGLLGAGIATFLARVLGFVGVIIWSLKAKKFRKWVPYRWFRKPDFRAVSNLLHLGFPVGFQLLAEVSVFVFATLLIGTMGEVPLAAHQIVLTCASTMFMVPVGFSIAQTVRIGEVVGARQTHRLHRILQSGWAIGLCYAVFSAACFLLLRHHIPAWFIKEPSVILLGARLLVIVAVFQLSDVLAIISIGTLRGLSDVKIPAWIAFAAYWMLAIPLAWALVSSPYRSAAAVWWCITIGLTVNAIAQSIRAWKKTDNFIELK